MALFTNNDIITSAVARQITSSSRQIRNASSWNDFGTIVLMVGVGVVGAWHAGKVLATALHEFYSGYDCNDMDESLDDDIVSWSYDFLGQNNRRRRKKSCYDNNNNQPQTM